MPWSKLGLLDRGVNGGRGTHDRTSDIVRYAIGDESRVNFWRRDVLLVRACEGLGAPQPVAVRVIPSQWNPVNTAFGQYVSLPARHWSQTWQVSAIGLNPARCPTFNDLTFSPTLTITPAPSWPAHLVPISDILGKAQSLSMKWISLRQRPVAFILIRTSSGPAAFIQSAGSLLRITGLAQKHGASVASRIHIPHSGTGTSSTLT